MKTYYKGAGMQVDPNTLLRRTLQEITSMTHFYSQSDGDCIGALQYTAYHMGAELSEDQARTLLPNLRGALFIIMTENGKGSGVKIYGDTGR